ncbi:hypothetical protein BDR26DRAFT_848536 [Obelidium mucronatum]|nr:hypothetical protein BDR26DRAFT_848536 [Obelidium mucronatum]
MFSKAMLVYSAISTAKACGPEDSASSSTKILAVEQSLRPVIGSIENTANLQDPTPVPAAVEKAAIDPEVSSRPVVASLNSQLSRQETLVDVETVPESDAFISTSAATLELLEMEPASDPVLIKSNSISALNLIAPTQFSAPLWNTAPFSLILNEHTSDETSNEMIMAGIKEIERKQASLIEEEFVMKQVSLPPNEISDMSSMYGIDASLIALVISCTTVSEKAIQTKKIVPTHAEIQRLTLSRRVKPKK